MKAHTNQFSVATRGKGTYEITDRVEAIVRASGVRQGVATVFVRHTSCSLVIMENADLGPNRSTSLFRPAGAGGCALFHSHV